LTFAVRLASLAMLAAALAPSSSARAATLTLTSDRQVYAPGETITLTLFGDSQGATDHSLFAPIVKPDPSFLSDLKLQRFAPPTSDGQPWIHGAQLAPPCGPNPSECYLINMIHFNGTNSDVGVDPALEPFTYAVLTGTAGLPGTYSIEWVNLPTRHVDFFGLTSAPGLTITIADMEIALIPEPATAPLLAFGLGGLAAARRRRAH
jgi:hypothetical protein